MASKENISPEHELLTISTRKLLLTRSLPLMLSMFVASLYNVVDSLFVSHISENALTAISLAFPIQLLMISITVGISIGINASLSRFLGEKNQKGVNEVASNGIFLALLVYLLFLIFGVFFTKSYFASQTSDPEICRLGVEYLSIVTILSLGSILQINFERFLQSTGKTTLSMISQLIGTTINIVLNPILIFGLLGFPKMGVIGAAIATVVGQTVAMGVAIFFNLNKNKEIQFSLQKFRPNGKIIGTILKVGTPAILIQALDQALLAFGVNLILIQSSSTVVAAFGVYYRVQSFALMPVWGLYNIFISIAAFNYGAKNRKRINETIKYGMLYASAIMLVGMTIIQLIPTQLLGLFDASEELISIGVAAMRIISLSYILLAFSVISQGFFQALGNGIYSLIVTLVRVAILFPTLYILFKVFEINVVWWAFVLANACSALVGAFLLKHIYSQKVATIVNRQEM